MSLCRLIVAYDGTDFWGWQKNGRTRTVQKVLERALSDLYGQSIFVEVASRTDRGVHALGQCAVFDAPKSRIDIASLPRILNVRLPRDVAIQTAEPVGSDFHPSLRALEKHYRYAICSSPQRWPLLR